MRTYTLLVVAGRSAWFGWTADQTAEPWRLPGSGTFCFAGGIRAIAYARACLRLTDVTQVQIRTNQSAKVLIYNKHANGAVTHYDAREE